uniref:50S ribosomal protein L19 n=1 Tax=candidate division WOR-3 bacterium TaxID=2052148 RepID=A0A7C4TJS6_UNCW3
MKESLDFKPGDLVKVYVKITEGDKTRLTPFQGVVLQIKGSGAGKTFTVRKVSAGIGVERIFPLNSPSIAKIEVKRRGKVRRAKLTYLRTKRAKKIKGAEPVPQSSEKKEEIPSEKEEKTEGSGGP